MKTVTLELFGSRIDCAKFTLNLAIKNLKKKTAKKKQHISTKKCSMKSQHKNKKMNKYKNYTPDIYT